MVTFATETDIIEIKRLISKYPDGIYLRNDVELLKLIKHKSIIIQKSEDSIIAIIQFETLNESIIKEKIESLQLNNEPFSEGIYIDRQIITTSTLKQQKSNYINDAIVYAGMFAVDEKYIKSGLAKSFCYNAFKLFAIDNKDKNVNLSGFHYLTGTVENEYRSINILLNSVLKVYNEIYGSGYIYWKKTLIKVPIIGTTGIIWYFDFRKNSKL